MIIDFKKVVLKIIDLVINLIEIIKLGFIPTINNYCHLNALVILNHIKNVYPDKLNKDQIVKINDMYEEFINN